MEYRVGQVLFLITVKNKVIPLQIVEEVTKVTMAGKTKTYNVLFPNKERSVAEITKLKGDIFPSKKEVKDFMIKNTLSAINTIIDEADQLSKKVFNIVETETDDTGEIDVDSVMENAATIESTNMQPSMPDDIILVDLGNGQKARMKRSETEKLGV